MKKLLLILCFLSLAVATLDVVVAQESEGRGMQRRRGMRARGGQPGGGFSDSSGLKVGQVAPTFKLKSLDGKSETDLASFKGKKPVVLLFGSYT